MKIKVDNLYASFGERTILSDLNLCIDQLGTVALLGSSGSGKSTFLRLLSGLNMIDNQRIRGKISIDGSTPSEYRTQGKIGFMFQDPSLFRHLNVIENIQLPLRLRKYSDLSYADHLIEYVGLSEFREQLPHELSGGMRTRVALARTIAPRPKLLLLDEPFTSLDISWRFQLYSELTKLQNELPLLTILVTHDIQEALLLSNHIMILGSEGRIVQQLELSESLPRISKLNPLANLQQEYTDLLEFFRNEK